MRRILLRVIPDSKTPYPSDPGYEANLADYRNMIESAIKVPMDRNTGATIEEMRRGIRVLDALDATPPEGVLELEDADWDHLKQKVVKMPWGYVDRRFVQFYDDIMQATEAPRDPTRVDGVASA